MATSIEKCRASLVAAYLMDVSELVELFGYTDTSEVTAEELEGLEALQHYSVENKTWGQAHSRGSFGMLKQLLRNGNGCVRIDYDAQDSRLTVAVDRYLIESHSFVELRDVCTVNQAMIDDGYVNSPWPTVQRKNLGRCLVYLREYDEAELLLLKVTKEFESNETINWAMLAYAHFAYGVLQTFRGNYNEADILFTKAQNIWLGGDHTRMHSFHGGCMYRMGYVALRSGNYNAAVKHIHDSMYLLKAGALILGKSNMTGRTGPTQPGGSSSGSAVGVAAGYAPIALGTETDGSCMQPASRASLFSIKTTPGSIPLDGTWLGSSTFDNICPMAKSVGDLAAATEVLLTEAARKALPADGFSSSFVKNFHNMTLGFVNPTKWRLPDSLFAPDAKIRSEMDDAYFNARHNISIHGGTVIKDVFLISPSELKINGVSDISTVIGFELRRNIDRYLSELSESEVRNLPELIDWIEQHKEQELPEEAPDQDRLIKALKDVPSQEKYENAIAHMRKISREDGIDETMRKHGLDVVVMPTESAICSIASAAGYPIATMPLGYLSEYEKPFGLSIMARAGEEQVLFKFMSAWETIPPRRRTPSKSDVARSSEQNSLI
ncbi:hypothetical protein KCU91_g10694, partial [Aureobasidium melanogenum]